MPKILIKEIDKTSSGTPGSYANYSVLITGYQKEFTAAEVTQAKLDIAAYEAAVANRKTNDTVVIPTLNDAAIMLKAREEYADENGVYEFSSEQDFIDVIGITDIAKPSKHSSTISDYHYGNKMAYELLKLGYSIVYKPITYVDEMYEPKFWDIFKDKASYDFRFICHGLLETNHDRASFNVLKAQRDAAANDITKLSDIYTIAKATVENSDAYKALTDEQKAAQFAELVASACENEYRRTIAPAGANVEGVGIGLGYTGFKDRESVPYGSYSNAYEQAPVVLQELEDLIERHDSTCITDTNFNLVNGNIAKLASYRVINGEEACPGRGDCIALIELDERAYVDFSASERPEDLIINGINVMSSSIGEEGAYCALIVPSVYYKLSEGIVKLPAAFHYLACFMSSLNSGFAEWYAAAGYTRGVSSYAVDHTSVKLGEIAINALEPRSITNQSSQPKFACNVIANFRGSYYLWGNRTAAKLQDAFGGGDLVAQHFLNIRQLCATIKKQLYVACRRFTFDPNSDTLWINFVNAITPTLEVMKADQGIRDYKVLKVYTDKKATLKAKIRIIPIEAVEDFDLEISLEDSFGETSAVVTE